MYYVTDKRVNCLNIICLMLCLVRFLTAVTSNEMWWRDGTRGSRKGIFLGIGFLAVDVDTLLDKQIEEK